MATTVDVAVSSLGDNDDESGSAAASDWASPDAMHNAHLSNAQITTGQLRNRFSTSSPSAAAVVAPTPMKRRRANPVTRAIGSLLHGTSRVFGFLLALVLLVLMSVPPLALLIALGWSAWATGKTLWDAAHVLRGLRIDLLSDKLDTLGLAVRIALASLSFFAMIFALSVLLGGLLAHGRRQWMTLPGMLLALLTMSCYFLTSLSLVSEAPRLGLPTWAGIAFVAYALLDAATLAVALTDTRPSEPQQPQQPPRERPRRNTNADISALPEPFLIPDEVETPDERFRTVLLPETRKWGTPPVEAPISDSTSVSMSAPTDDAEDDDTAVVPVISPEP